MPPASAVSPTIYIVDDDDSVRRALERLLRAAGWHARGFASGKLFLAVVPPEARGCVVMDIRMPGLTGYDVQRALDARGLVIPVIALSAEDGDEARRKAGQLGAVAFFRKPVDDRALLGCIQSTIDALEYPPAARPGWSEN